MGFLIASWFTFLAFGFITLNFYIAQIGIVLTVCAAAIALGYVWVRRQKSHQAEEIFP
jgi:Flp pilus assembly protein TadB